MPRKKGRKVGRQAGVGSVWCGVRSHFVLSVTSLRADVMMERNSETLGAEEQERAAAGSARRRQPIGELCRQSREMRRQKRLLSSEGRKIRAVIQLSHFFSHRSLSLSLSLSRSLSLSLSLSLTSRRAPAQPSSPFNPFMTEMGRERVVYGLVKPWGCRRARGNPRRPPRTQFHSYVV